MDNFYLIERRLKRIDYSAPLAGVFPVGGVVL